MPKENIDNSANSELVLELVEVLKKEASLFETFLELLERQQKALVKNDVESLNAVTEEQRHRVIEAGILAKKREGIIGELSLKNGMKENLTVSNLIEAVSGGQARVLEQIRDVILELNERIHKVRNQNEMLIDRSREIIMKTMEMLARVSMPDDKYHSEGKIKAMQTSLTLDRRI
jgi:hypothetical protein